MSAEKKETIQDVAKSIRAFGFSIIWRNSNTVRYLRVWLHFWTWRYEFDLFRKDKLLDRLSKSYHIGDLPSEGPQKPLHISGSTSEGLKKSIRGFCQGKTNSCRDCSDTKK